MEKWKLLELEIFLENHIDFDKDGKLFQHLILKKSILIRAKKPILKNKKMENWKTFTLNWFKDQNPLL